MAAIVALLRACGKQKDLSEGSRVHAEILKRGLLKENIYVGSTLVDMYAKCGALAKAQQVFEELPVQDVVTWTALIAGYAQHGHCEEALSCFTQMQDEGLSPNAVTFACILKACGNIGASKKGEQIHAQIVKVGLLGKKTVLDNALVDMYTKCGALAKAQEVFDELPSRNVISWTALIAGYAQHGHPEEALNCFERMQHEGLSPNAVTFACILKACGSVGASEKGREIHAEIVRADLLGKDVVLSTALVDMYAKCGVLAKAQKVFDGLSNRNVVSWNALIAGYAQQGHGREALACFDRMQSEGLLPDVVTFACILKACGSIGAAEKGKEVHADIVREGLLGNSGLGNALVDMYTKCGELAKAQQVFDELPARSAISWNTVISGYAQHGYDEEALQCLEGMQREGLSPNAVTFACILKVCGRIGASQKGEELHAEIVREGLIGKDVMLGNAVVDMYAKCGALAKAAQVCDELPTRDVVSWNALIAGFVQHGYGEEACNCLEQMQHEGFFPDTVTYTCMVDLFGRAGHLDKAMKMIEKMSFHDLGAWFALLGACRTWGHVKLGKLAFEHAVRLDKKYAVAHVYMSNIYAAAGMQEDAYKIEAMRVRNEAWRKPGSCRWTDKSGNVHSFSVGDKAHSQSKRIYLKLEDITRRVLQEGFCPEFQSGVTRYLHT